MGSPDFSDNIKNNINDFSNNIKDDVNNIGINFNQNSFALEKTQDLGKATQTYDSTIVPTGLQNHILGYNPKDSNFFSTIPSNYNMNDCDSTKFFLDSTTSYYKTVDNLCYLSMSDISNNVYTTVNLPDSGKTLSTLDNGNKGQFCSQREVCKNKINSDTISQQVTHHDYSIQNRLDTTTHKNIQIINIINISIGIALALFTVYKFRS